MHNNVHSSARRWYVALAFILIVIVLVLAGCASFDTADRVEQATLESEFTGWRSTSDQRA